MESCPRAHHRHCRMPDRTARLICPRLPPDTSGKTAPSTSRRPHPMFLQNRKGSLGLLTDPRSNDRCHPKGLVSFLSFSHSKHHYTGLTTNQASVVLGASPNPLERST